MKQLSFICIFLFITIVRSQDVELPFDFRQHNLTSYNSSIFNPANTLYGNNPESVALWFRWQWQSIDGDPTTYFLSYSRAINDVSAFSVAFFQHNSGLFLQTGGVVNYAYAFQLSENTQLILGANVFGYQNELADDRFIQDPDMILPLPLESNDFILQFAPGILLMADRLSIGLTSENLVDYNFNTNESQTDNKIALVSLGYDFPVSFLPFDEEASIRPIIYFKSIPDFDNQLGINALLSSSKFWAQAGYNNFYGVSVGAGGRFFKKLSLGVLAEFSTSSDQDGFDPTLELSASYFIGPLKEREKQVMPEDEEPEEEEELITEDEKTQEELELEAEKARQEEQRQAELAQQEEQQRLEQERIEQERAAELARQEEERQAELIIQAELARIEEERLAEEARKAREQFVADSINSVRQAEEEAARKQAELEEIAEDEKPQAGEKYQEVESEEGLQPGYYLVANVFGTKRYFENFMKTLTEMGLQPKSFYRSENKYNYVYLERYDSMREARRARDSQFDGRYKDKTWIFRVVGN